jgi:hypothetical protein
MCDEGEIRLSPEEERRRLQIIHEVDEAMARHSAPYITAIARPVANDEGDFIGSGSFMIFGGQAFLITARHVAMDAQMDAVGGAAFSNGDAKPYQLITAPFITDENLDVAIVPVTLDREPGSTRLACPSDYISQVSGPLRDWLFVHGFPGERSRFLRISEAIHSKTLPYGTATAIPSWSDFNPNLHFAVGFDPTSAQHSDGTSATLPDPHGMSGSAVWNTRRSEIGAGWKPTDARIMGVIHRWDQTADCLIGTRIEHVHGLIARSWPPPKNSAAK